MSSSAPLCEDQDDSTRLLDMNPDKTFHGACGYNVVVRHPRKAAARLSETTRDDPCLSYPRRRPQGLHQLLQQLVLAGKAALEKV